MLISSSNIYKYIRLILARDASRLLQKLTSDERKNIINQMAKNLITYSKDILQANKYDLDEASKGGLF